MSKRNRKPNTIQASAQPSQFVFDAPVEIQAAAGENKLPTFKISAYTGAAMRVNGFYTPVIVDLSGIKASRSKLPILLNHDPDRIIGQADKIDIGPDGISLSGAITGNDADAQKVVTHAKNGFEWQASIGSSIDSREIVDAGKTARVNGREVAGPVLIARKSTLNETSFVAIGADGNTAAKVAAKSSQTPTSNRSNNMDKQFKQWLEAKGIDADKLEAGPIQDALKAQFDAEQADKAKAGDEAAAPKSVKAAASETDDLAARMAERRREQDQITAINKMAVKYADQYPHHIDMIEAMAVKAKKEKWSITDLELAYIRETRVQAPNAIIRDNSDRQIDGQVIEAAICMTARLADVEKKFPEKVLEAAHKRWPRGIGLGEVLVTAARQNGYDGITASDLKSTLKYGFNSPDIRASGFSNINLPTVFGTTVNRFLLQGFNSVETAWRSIAKIGSVRDFRQKKNVRRIGSMLFGQVGPDGQLKHGTMSEETYTNQAKTYGGMYGITREQIVNDDLGALSDTPVEIGRNGAIRLNKEFWTEFLDDASFFSVGNDNLLSGAGSALGINGISAAEAAFFDLKDPNGDPISVTPRTLLVPNALNALGSQLMRSLELRDTTDDTKYGTNNPHAGKFNVVRSSYLTSTIAWYLLADPMDLPVIEVVFLNGVQQPTVETADADFNSLGIQMRGYFDFGVEKQDYRGGVKNAGQ